MARRPLPPESIQAIRVRTYAMAASLGHTDVRSEFGARFSLPFAVASLLCHGRSGLDNYDAAAVADPRIQALARRVEVAEDPGLHARLPGAAADRGDGGARRRHADVGARGLSPGRGREPAPAGRRARGSSSSWPRRCGAGSGRRRSTTACSTSSACPTWLRWRRTRAIARRPPQGQGPSPCSAHSQDAIDERGLIGAGQVEDHSGHPAAEAMPISEAVSTMLTRNPAPFGGKYSRMMTA